MLCFKRACVWACLFFHEANLRRIHAVTTKNKKWTERRDARAKLSFSLQKPIALFAILVAVAVGGSPCLS